MENNDDLKWYFKTGFLIFAFLCVGPLMLPLVWWHPRLSLTNKILFTLMIVFLSYILFVYFFRSLKSLVSYYQLIMQSNR